MSETETLFGTLRAYGADVQGAMTRFLDDGELYIDCLRMFMLDESFTTLGEALESPDYQRAFDAAHTLKGVAANLGLTPMLGPINAIVEPLRAGRHEGVAESFVELKRQKAILEALIESK